ncbi:MAG: hypothetical protein KA138_12940 [Saprospiraceae bacterium]|jgi:hypothetical protein|nr:hypothetical protein [Lewinellaceae bacterium]MBP6812425.1 hypothetical protein [Saprospiraceae bacterium]
MEELVIKIKDARQRNFLLEILGSLDFIEIVPQNRLPKAKSKSVLTPEQQLFVDDLKEAIKDVDLHLSGKKILPNARQALQNL